MKKVIVLVGMVLMLSGLSYAAGPPVQPVPDVKGWWVADFILTQTGGSGEWPSTVPPAPAPVPNVTPFYQNSGVKRAGSVYMNVTYQFGTKITGDYHTYMSGGWYAIPFEGWVYGNLFQIFTSTDNGPLYGREEERYLNGIISTDSGGNKIIRGLGVVSRNVSRAPESSYHYYSWNNNLYTFTMRPYSGDTYPPAAGLYPSSEQSSPRACPFVCCPLPTCPIVP